MFEGSRLGIQVSIAASLSRHIFFQLTFPFPSGLRTLRPPCGASIGVLRPPVANANVPAALVAVMAVTGTATVREIGTVTVIVMTVRILGTGKGEIGTRIEETAGIANVTSVTRKRKTNVAAGAPNASAPHHPYLSKRKTLHLPARVKILACLPAWIKN